MSIPTSNWSKAAALLALGVVLLISCFPPIWHVMGQSRQSIAFANLQQFVFALKKYKSDYGALPTGTHTQIMASLRGNNRFQIIYCEVPPKSFNARGEWLDPWETPYRIDTTNPAFPWAYSFGKNGIDDGGLLGTDDVTSW